MGKQNEMKVSPRNGLQQKKSNLGWLFISVQKEWQTANSILYIQEISHNSVYSDTF